MPAARGVAFFDVDETLVSVRTLEAFLLYYMKLVPTMISHDRLRELSQQVLELDRTEFNRLYFGIWAGQPASRVLEAGRTWYAEAAAEPGFFRPGVLRKLREHQEAGDDVVLVSGSFRPPLAPLADALGVDGLYCTELEVADGAYTGAISQAMIGDDKRHVVEARLGSPDGELHSWGYGDHPSDLPLLERVENPVVVGSDPDMLKVAGQRHWPVMAIERPLAPRR